ncbi:uncharacterized protein TNCV_1254751 [Trichonephila clavipes]|nr:uncharacterized protein TNCV_1254751 [Trichonephila clavipes]
MISSLNRKSSTKLSRWGLQLSSFNTTLSPIDAAAAEGEPVPSEGSQQLRSCPYYLRSRFKEPEGLPEEQRSTGLTALPQNSLRRRSLSLEALDGDPADRST